MATVRCKDKTAQLCDTCSKEYPKCDSDEIDFGLGLGFDNIVECDAYDGPINPEDIEVVKE